MVVNQDVKGFFPSVLADQISRTFWKEAVGTVSKFDFNLDNGNSQYQSHLDEGWASLE
jgi:hypothetical protein